MSIGPVQILIILAIVLLFFGPKRLPGLARSLGESIRGFKKSLDGDSRDVTDSVAHEKLDEPENDQHPGSAQTNKRKETEQS